MPNCDEHSILWAICLAGTSWSIPTDNPPRQPNVVHQHSEPGHNMEIRSVWPVCTHFHDNEYLCTKLGATDDSSIITLNFALSSYQ